MSRPRRESVVRIQPGESAEDFTSRIATTAPEPPSEVIDQLRALLPTGVPAPAVAAGRGRKVRSAA